jgi:hypothetical protein
MPRTRRHSFLFVSVLFSLVATRQARSAEPLLVNGAGQPLAWAARPIPYNPDLGTLGALGNAAARQFVSDRFRPWSDVTTAAVSFADAGSLPADVTAANITSYFGVCGDGLNPIIFDTDGSIVRALLGTGNENVVLGMAGPDCGSYVPPVITEGGAILNGRFIDGIQSSSNPEISLEAFGAVFTHEFGHYAGLGHSQINLREAFDGDPSNDNAVATMFPILVNGPEQATLELDDRVAISMLYPAPSVFASMGSIQGTIVQADGSTPFQGAYVIARSVVEPRLLAVGVPSGFLFVPDAAGGPPPPRLQGYYELDGLLTGTDYTVEIEAIDPSFTGGSGVGPLDPPVAVPVPEFWNGANEAATNPPDDPTQATPITVSAGTPVSDIDIIMNHSCETGDCLSGRGSTQKACIAEWLVVPQPVFTGRPPTRLSCRDGANCDADGDATNHRCTFHLALCLNNHDPRLPRCTPTDVATVDLRTPNPNGVRNKPEDTVNANALLSAIAGISGGVPSGTCTNPKRHGSCAVNADCDSPGKHDGRCHRFVAFAPPAAAPNVCSAPAVVVVPLTHTAAGGFTAASKRIGLRTSSSAHRTDIDVLTLQCLPALLP